MFWIKNRRLNFMKKLIVVLGIMAIFAANSFAGNSCAVKYRGETIGSVTADISNGKVVVYNDSGRPVTVNVMVKCPDKAGEIVRHVVNVPETKGETSLKSGCYYDSVVVSVENATCQ